MSNSARTQNNEIAFLIPDISGFTNFLKNTEISHSKHIIEELMSLLIKETKESFHVAEVEGDALFLYQDANKLTLESIYAIVENAFKVFHTHLLNYNQLKICNCGACSTTIDLSLKFVLHFGQVEFLSVNGKEKPYGIEVIKAHRLLKNDIKNREYILFSEDFQRKYGLPQAQGKFIKGSTDYKDLDTLNYFHLEIGDLKNGLKPDHINTPINQKLQTIVSHSLEIDAPIDIVYEVLSEFKYRPIWNKEAQVVEQDHEDIYKIGTEHFCIINNKKFKIKTVSDNNSGLEFGEQIMNNGFFKEFNLYFIFNNQDQQESKTNLTIEIRIEAKTFFRPLINWLIKPKMSKKIPEMSLLIKELSEKIHTERDEDIDVVSEII